MAMARKDWSEKQPIMRATLYLPLFLLVILGDNFFQLRLFFLIQFFLLSLPKISAAASLCLYTANYL